MAYSKWACLVLALLSMAYTGSSRYMAPPKEIALDDDGGWSWFEDERAIVAGGGLWVGSVANGSRDPLRAGNVNVVRYDLETGKIDRAALHKSLQADDHNSPALLERPDGRILALYSKHGPENRIYFRVSEDAARSNRWGPERVYVPSPSSRITYSNLHFLKRENALKGRVYDFFRGLDDTFKPSWMWSDDLGETWNSGGVLIDFSSTTKQRPYVKYASDGRDTIHFLFTEAHPRNFDNSIYHAYYRAGRLHRSDGAAIRELKAGPILPSESTRIFAGDPANVAWTHDIHLDSRGRPYAGYSVQKDSAGLPSGPAGQDHRYRYARWDGKKWHDHEIAYAGRRLYPGEDDYTGGISLHPRDPNTVFISTNVDPSTGRALPSDHHEIFRGRTRDGGKTWRWEPITRNSTVDNLRPIVPIWKDKRTALIWMRGQYHTYTRYNLEVVLKILE